MAESGERQSGRNDQNLRGSQAATPDTPKLADLGISKTQSSRWQSKARMPEDKFEQHVEAAKKKATTAGVSTAAPRQALRAPKDADLALATLRRSMEHSKVPGGRFVRWNTNGSGFC